MLAVHALHLEGLLSGHMGQLLFPGLVISAAAAAAALAAEVTDGRPEPDGDNHDDKDEKDDIFRSHCSASFLGEGDAAPRRTSPSVNGSMFLLVFGLLAMSAAVSCALSAIRTADADFPPFFGPIQVKQDSADDADQDGHNDDVYHNFTGSWQPDCRPGHSPL